MGIRDWFRRARGAVEDGAQQEGREPTVDADGGAGPAREADEADDAALGWDAITAVFDGAYPGQTPLHWGTILPMALGGQDPLRGVSAYRASEPVPHWHYVTYGYSDLFGDLHEDAVANGEPTDVSGYGVEMTFRLVDESVLDPDAAAPTWVVSMLQNLARYVFRSGNVIYAGHHLNAGGPIALDEDTALVALGCIDDPIHPEPLATEYGEVRFVQAVGLTDAELELAASWNTRKVIELVGDVHGYGLTRLGRDGIETDVEVWARAQRSRDEEGSSVRFFNVETLGVSRDGDDLVIDLVGPHAGTFEVVAGRLVRGESMRIIGRDHVLELVPEAEQPVREVGDITTTLSLTAEGAAALAECPESPFELRLDAIPGVVWRVAATRAD